MQLLTNWFVDEFSIELFLMFFYFVFLPRLFFHFHINMRMFAKVKGATSLPAQANIHTGKSKGAIASINAAANLPEVIAQIPFDEKYREMCSQLSKSSDPDTFVNAIRVYLPTYLPTYLPIYHLVEFSHPHFADCHLAESTIIVLLLLFKFNRKEACMLPLTDLIQVVLHKY